MTALEARKAELGERLRSAPEDKPHLLPTAAAIYGKKVAKLAEALNQPRERPEAAEALRMLIEKIVLSPGPNRGEIDATLHGELGQILNWIEHQAAGKSGKTNRPRDGVKRVSVSVVAGARNRLQLQTWNSRRSDSRVDAILRYAKALHVPIALFRAYA